MASCKLGAQLVKAFVCSAMLAGAEVVVCGVLSGMIFFAITAG